MQLIPDKHIEEINRLHTEVRSLAEDAYQRAMRIGELLCDVRKRAKHGEWLEWLNRYVSFSERTANNYMAVYRNKELLKSANVADLGEAYLLLRRHHAESTSERSGEPTRSLEENEAIIRAIFDGLWNLVPRLREWQRRSEESGEPSVIETLGEEHFASILLRLSERGASRGEMQSCAFGYLLPNVHEVDAYLEETRSKSAPSG